MCCWRFIPGKSRATPCWFGDPKNHPKNHRRIACDSAVIAANLMPKAGEANLTSKTSPSDRNAKQTDLTDLTISDGYGIYTAVVMWWLWQQSMGQTWVITQTMRWLMCAQNDKPICETLMPCSMACMWPGKTTGLTQNKWSHIFFSES